MNRVIARLAFASVLLLVIASVAPGAVLAAARGQNQQPLVIAVQPTATPEQLSADAQELRLFLEQHPSQPVQLVFPTTFAGVIEALRFGHAHAAFMSAWLHRKRWPPSSVVPSFVTITEQHRGRDIDMSSYALSLPVPFRCKRTCLTHLPNRGPTLA